MGSFIKFIPNSFLQGVITLRHLLDREEKYLHEVPVVAIDGGGRTGYMLLRVAVGDINDNAPQFQANEYKASIHANMSIGTTILTVGLFHLPWNYCLCSCKFVLIIFWKSL